MKEIYSANIAINTQRIYAYGSIVKEGLDIDLFLDLSAI